MFALLRLLGSVPKAEVVPFTALLAVNAVLVVLQPLLLGSVVGAVASVATGSGAISTLTGPLVGLIAGLLANAAVQAGTSVGATKLERAVDGQIRHRIRTAISADPGLLAVEDAAVQDDAAAAREGAHGVQFGVATGDTLRVVFQYVNAALLALVVARASVLSAVVMSVAIVVARVLSINLGVRRAVPRLQAASLEQRALYFRGLTMGARAAKEVRIFGTGSWLTNQMTAAWNAFYAPLFSLRRGYLWQFTVLYFILALAYGVGMTPLLLAAMDGRLSLGAFTAAISAAVAMLICLAQSYTRYLFVGEPVRAYERLLARPAPMNRSTATLPVDAPQHEIRIKGLVFNYPGKTRPVFDGLDLVLRAGESVGLVGINGAGKTTLVKLLSRMYEPAAGSITVDGVDLSTVDLDHWRARMAVLFQDFVRYELSMADNIRCGRLCRSSDSDLLSEVVSQAGLAGVVARLPAGLDTPLSTAYAGGTDLSGGEWQRTALARALYAVRGGAGVLVLDEPTAAYDVKAEEELFSRFLDLTKGITTLLISHRLSAVRRAQRILVLDGGRIVEDGSHIELMSLGGLYARMFTMQATGVREGRYNEVDVGAAR
ncbi:MAG: ABC transporter ATP-binding protein [Pseudonocardiaceae bacterium]